MGALKSLGTLLLLIALTGCGGGDSSPQLVDGSQAAELPVVLDGLNDAVLTRTSVLAASDVDRDEFAACWVPATGDTTGLKHIAVVVERVGLRGSSLTFRTGSALYGCDKIPNPFTAEDPDLPYGGIWCASPNGRFDEGGLNDPRLSLCPNTENDVTAFVWVEPQPDAKWIVVSDAGRREVYEVAAWLPVRVATTDGVQPENSRASFDVEEYSADGRKLRAYTLDEAVAG